MVQINVRKLTNMWTFYITNYKLNNQITNTPSHWPNYFLGSSCLQKLFLYIQKAQLCRLWCTWRKKAGNLI